MPRKLLGMLLLIGSASFVMAQQPPPPPDRYKVQANLSGYPQATPKDAITSVLRAIDRGRLDYLAGQLLDPAFMDARVTARAVPLEQQVDRELRAKRDEQRTLRTPGERLPLDPGEFDAIVTTEARQRAFRLILGEIRDSLAENPDYVRDLQKFQRDADYAELGETMQKATLREVTDRAVFLKKIGERWFMMDTRQDPPAPKPAAPAAGM